MTNKVKMLVAVIAVVLVLAGGAGFYLKGENLMGRMMRPTQKTITATITEKPEKAEKTEKPEKSEQSTSFTTSSSNITYTVTYHTSGANYGTAPSVQTKIHGVPLTLSTNTGNLFKLNHTFEGWNTAPNGAGVNYPTGTAYTDNAPVTLYAKWTADDELTYPVFYHANGADKGTAPAPASYPFGTEVTAAGPGNLKKTGHTFGGWLWGYGFVNIRQPGDKFIVYAGTHNHRAKWDINVHTLTYHADDATGGTVPESVSKTYGQYVLNVSSGYNPGNLVKEGYTFIGWEDKARGWLSGDTDYVTLYNDIDLHARWRPGL